MLTYTTLFKIGYHPKCWKESVGIILPKANKPDYTKPKAYWIILLFNYLGKILEKVMASKLIYLTNTKDLLNNIQIGNRKQRSAIDITLLLIYHIQ